MSKNEEGHIEKYHLITRIYIYLPYINLLKKEKGLDKFNELEIAIYIFKNGIDDDIMKTKKKVVEIMEKKVEKFNEDIILQDMAFNRDLNRRARKAKEKREHEEGLRIGKEEGRKETLKYNVVKLFMKMNPNHETDFLDHLSLEQYEKIFDLLLEEASLEDIYKIAQKKLD